jgi:hypothetical protein
MWRSTDPGVISHFSPNCVSMRRASKWPSPNYSREG